MIWSVSMLGNGSTAVCERMSRNGSISPAQELAWISYATADRCRSRDSRAREQRACACALAALEVAVAGADAVRTARDGVAVHADAHRAAGLAPLGARFLEHTVEALGLGGPLDRL